MDKKLTYFQQKVLAHIYKKGPVCKTKSNYIYLRYRGPQRKEEFEELITEGYLNEEIIIIPNGNLKRLYTLGPEGETWVGMQSAKGDIYTGKRRKKSWE